MSPSSTQKMAITLSPLQTSSSSSNPKPPPFFFASSSFSTFSIPYARSHFLVSSRTHLCRPFPNHRRHYRIAASPGPPRPPEPGPTRTDLSPRSKGNAESFSRLRDTLQIFLAVLFWMSLFFWASAWDKNNRPNKGSRFRR